MNDFLRMILNRLSDAIPLAIVAVVLCAIGIGVAYLLFKKKYKDTRKIFANGNFLVSLYFFLNSK